MKNAILGCVGGVLLILMVLTMLSIHDASCRKNELEKHLPRLVEDTLENYYQKTLTEEQAREILYQSLEETVATKANLEITIVACDMEKGILSVVAESSYSFPNGKIGKVAVGRTAIVDRKLK